MHAAWHVAIIHKGQSRGEQEKEITTDPDYSPYVLVDIRRFTMPI
jgi:hypothetical protein